MSDELPKGLNSWHFQGLKQIADVLAIRYMCEFYLVGSFISKGIEGSDIDIIMVADNKRIKRLFGSDTWNDKRMRFYFKQKMNIEQTIDDMDIDFKVQSYDEFNKIDMPRIKLDSLMPYRRDD